MVEPDAVFRCPDCERLLLIVMDAGDPGLPGELAVKVDGHVCPNVLPPDQD